MYAYGNYDLPQYPSIYYPYVQLNENELYRQQQLSQLFQLPQWTQLQRRVNQLERQNDQQEREIDQLRRRLQRVNQRLRTVERRLNIHITPFEGEY
ncbi:hypothetical protein AN964_17980 [Heyndrickxia shackletonii]|uniref:Uncharacterized protein n=1 Tax=Heyndrickxia shackletonii TaxID=157838 RepID=A0A0Q3X0N4_9BACI|nr:hypothetical protein [Heyndrickxia shackletonii]KQL55212.1 hypothetical protein AN964_17980 [Heyndrickxia shackletonii]NEY98735.1 hypothetical protein [Heyndrickxia shackletonii]